MRGPIRFLLILAAAKALVYGALLAATGILRRPRRIGTAEVGRLHDETRIEADGSVCSVQSSTARMETTSLEAIWSPEQLERVALDYWRFIGRFTLGLLRVVNEDGQTRIVLAAAPVVLLAFGEPEFTIEARCGAVRWEIESGFLLAGAGAGPTGSLEIGFERSPSPTPDRSNLRIEMAVYYYRPRIAALLGRRVYAATQSRVHVLVTFAFMRSLARLELAPLRAGRASAQP